MRRSGTGTRLYELSELFLMRVNSRILTIQSRSRMIWAHLLTNFLKFFKLAGGCLDRCAECVGNYFLARWRPLLGLLVSLGLVWGLVSYTPGTIPALVIRILDFLLHTLPAYFESVQVRASQWCGSGMVYLGSWSRYAFLEFRIRILIMSFKHIWKLLQKNFIIN